MAYYEHLSVKIATLYYLKRQNQEQIAEKLGISRQSVSRHLKYANEKGIIQYGISSPLSFCSELEYRLETDFGLKEAVVVSSAVNSEEIVRNEIGKALAEFLDRRIRDGDTLGISWSSTVLACAKHLKRKAVEGIRVVQLNGSMDKAAYSTRAEYIIEQFCLAFGGTPVTMTAPMLVDSPKILKTLLADSRIQGSFDLAKRTNLALLGIGCISKESSLYKAGYMDDELLDHLLSKGAEGDICGHFFNGEGDICDKAIDERLLAVPRENLLKKSLSVGIAGGPGKVRAIRAALKGRWCNVLITDEETAKALVDIQHHP